MKALIRVPFWALYAQVVIAAVVVALFVHLFALSWQDAVDRDRQGDAFISFLQLARTQAVAVQQEVRIAGSLRAKLEHGMLSDALREVLQGASGCTFASLTACAGVDWLTSFFAANTSSIYSRFQANNNTVTSSERLSLSIHFVLPFDNSSLPSSSSHRRLMTNATSGTAFAPLASFVLLPPPFNTSYWNALFHNSTLRMATEALSYLKGEEDREVFNSSSNVSLSSSIASAYAGSSTFTYVDYPLLPIGNCSACGLGGSAASRTRCTFPFDGSGFEYASLTGFAAPLFTSHQEAQFILLTLRFVLLRDVVVSSSIPTGVPVTPMYAAPAGPSSCSDLCFAPAATAAPSTLSAVFLVTSSQAKRRRSVLLLPACLLHHSSSLFPSRQAVDALAMVTPEELLAPSAWCASSSGQLEVTTFQPMVIADATMIYGASVCLSATSSMALLFLSPAASSSQQTLFTLIVVTWTVLIGVGVVTAFAIRTSLIQPLNSLAFRMRNATRLRFSSSRGNGGRNSGSKKRSFFMFTELENLLQTYGALESSTRMFSKYVPREVVKDLMVVAAGGEQGGGGDDGNGFGDGNSSSRQSFSVFLRRQKQVEQRLITVLFADIANFTTFCEMVPTEDLVVLLDHYFSNMTTTLLQHGCTIDKFIGDAIMGFWGAPLDYTTQGFSCCCAALHLQKMVLLMTPVFNTVGFELIVRVGCHRGFAVVGNVGCSQRMSYTALGDTVNAASRLEGLNKMFGSRIIVSAPVAEDIAEADKIFVLRDLGSVKVKGKSEAINTFHLVGIAPDAVNYVRRMAAAGATSGYSLPPQQDPNDVSGQYLLENTPSSFTVPAALADDPAAELQQKSSFARQQGTAKRTTSKVRIVESSTRAVAPQPTPPQTTASQSQQMLLGKSMRRDSRRSRADDRSGSGSSDDDAESIFSGTAVRTHIRVVDGIGGGTTHGGGGGGQTAAPLHNGRGGGNARTVGAGGNAKGVNNNGNCPSAAPGGGKTTVFEKVAKWSAEAELEQISHGFTITPQQQQYIALLNTAARYYAGADVQMAAAVLKEALDPANDVILEDIELPKEPLLRTFELWTSLVEQGVDPATFDPSIVLTSK